MCKKCFDKETVLCSRCKKRIWKEDANDACLCDECYENYTYCNKCRKMILISDSYYKNDIPYCKKCYTRRMFMKNIDRTVILTITNDNAVIYSGECKCNYSTADTHFIRNLISVVLNAVVLKDSSITKTKSAFIRRCILNIVRVIISNYPTNSASDNDRKVYDSEISYRFTKIKVTARIIQTTVCL